MNGDTETATVTVTINPVADTTADVVSTDEDTPVTFNVLSNDNFEGLVALTNVTGAANGTVTFTAAGEVTYTPNADFNGSETLTYTVTEDDGSVETGTITITVNAVSDIADDAVSVDEDSAVDIDVLANDSYAGSASVTSVTQGANGTVTINSDGTVKYTPADDFHGSDSFTYTVTDVNGDTETATVTVTINPVSDAVSDSVSTNEDTPVAFNVLSNDSFEGSVSLTNVIGATNGTVTFTAAGEVTYTPNADFNGSETLTYTVTEDDGSVETGTITITVNAVSDIADDAVSVDEDSAVDIDVLANDSYSGSALVTSVTQGTFGTVAINPDGTVRYSANADYHGSDSFTYTVTDVNGDTETATVTVTINPVSDTASDSVTTDEDTPVTFDVLTNDSFEGSVSLTNVVGAINGSVTFTAAGEVTYTPNADFNGSETLTYSITEDDGSIETGTITITVNAVSDIADDTVSVDEDSAVDIDVLANDSYAGSASVTSVTQGVNGTVTINSDGTVKYTPADDFHGSDSFTYTVTDVNGDMETATCYCNDQSCCRYDFRFRDHG